MRAFFSLSILVYLVCPAAAADQCKRPEAITKFGKWFEPNIALNSGNVTALVEPGLPGFSGSSIRLLLQVVSSSGHPWHAVIRDPSYRVLANFSQADFVDQAAGRWTGRLGSLAVRIDLVGADNETTLKVLQGVAYPKESDDVRLFSTAGTVPSWVGLYQSYDATPKRTGDSVGMMLVTSSFDSVQKHSWCCTGTMVARDLMLTNWHCGGDETMLSEAYWNPGICANTIVDLGWDDGNIRRQYGCVQVAAKSRRLDYALFRVKPLIGEGGGVGEVVPAAISASNLTAAQPVFVVHHAQCRPKLLSANCKAQSVHFHGWDDATQMTEFTHDCDTEPGASGAPVFDLKGKLVGLHHLGFDRDQECGPLDHVNKAVRIDEILRDLPASALEEIRGF